MKSKRLIVGQIGIGYWGPNILRNFYLNENSVVKKVVDLSLERINAIKNEYKDISFSQKLSSIFEDKEIDAVIISTPANTHYELAMQSLNFGKHVFIEKPMAQNINQINDILRLSEEKNLLAMVGHTYMYNSSVRYIKKVIEQKKIGKLRYFFCERTNLGKVRSDVDAAWNLAPHDISVIQYIMNDEAPLKISNNGMSFLQKGINDVSFIKIEYKKNINAFIHVNWLSPLKKRKITIVGSEKMIVFDDMAENKIAIHNKTVKLKSHNSRVNFSYVNNGIDYPDINEIEPLKAEVEHFIDCILNKKVCLTGPKHALNVIKILSENENFI